MLGDAPRKAPRRVAITAVLAVVAALTLTGGAPPPLTSAAPPAKQSCEQPDCFAAIAFNAKTGAWGKAKNFPTRDAAKRQAIKACKSFEHKDKHCEVLGAARGEKCIGAAMKVKERTILAHAADRATTRREAWRSAARDLPGKKKLRHRITAVCNS